MEEDIKRITNDFVGRALIYMFSAPFIMTMIRGIVLGLGFNDNIAFLMYPVLLILLLLLPTMKDLKVSPLETNKKMRDGISLVDMIALIFMAWSLYFFIAAALNTITKIEIVGSILQFNRDLAVNSMGKLSPVLITVTSLINIVIMNLIFRGVLLNSLREYGDIFAIIASSTIYALMQGNPLFIPFHFMISILAGGLYVLSNDIKVPILFSLLLNFDGEYLRKYIPKPLGSSICFYGIMFIVGSIFLTSRKDFRNYILLHKSQYIEEGNNNKGKYAAVFKSEAFMGLLVLFFLIITLALISRWI